MTARRSGAKKKRANTARRSAHGGKYPPEVKAAALAALEAGGTLGDVHADTGVPKATLHRWAKAAGIGYANRAAAQTENATATVRARVAALQLETAGELRTALARQLATLNRLTTLEAEVAIGVEEDRRVTWESSIAGPVAFATDATVREAEAALAVVRKNVSKRDLVGAVGLLVDKLEVLAGRATERGELVVRFGIPRPDADTADAAAVHLPPVEE